MLRFGPAFPGPLRIPGNTRRGRVVRRLARSIFRIRVKGKTMKLNHCLAAFAVFALISGPAIAGQKPSPANAEVYFLSPKDGDVIDGPVTIVFGLRGMGIAPALVKRPNTGHHHVIVDVPVPGGDKPIPRNDGKNYFHFSGGHTEATLNLAPGTHTLQLVFADHEHYSHNPPVVSAPVTITVR